ncbi:hypothetical protein NQ317_012785 [Molorchus minor]|uniref:Fibronectin type-III domain-containing protein n=1 Tax=Molorchus minor TaxID=1323400 RepID=A0ABQ9K5J5_9CUCU|nr:hypothetical protein NQ317_012785 [Molorchus minor]
MALSRCIFFLLSCIAAIHLVTSDGCAPGTVTNLSLNGSGILTWDTDSGEECQISYYIVYVTLLNGTIQWTYTTEEPHAEVTHLEPCEGYSFRVHQVSSDNVTGTGWAIYSVTPPPSDADLALQSVRLTQDDRRVRLEWALDGQYARCARRYRVVVYNEDSDIPEDHYTSLTSLYVNNIVPCAHYTFAIRALFTLEEEGPITSLQHTAAQYPAAIPSLASISTSDQTVSFTWHLDDLQTNRCDMTALIFDGAPYISASYPIYDQANRTPLSLTISSLRADTLYYLRVRVNNTAGLSDPFQIAFQTQES